MNLLLQFKRRYMEAKFSQKITYVLYSYFSWKPHFFPIPPPYFIMKNFKHASKLRLFQWTSVCLSPSYGNISLYLFYPLSICLVIPLDSHQAILFSWRIWDYIADVSTFPPKHFIMHAISWRSVLIYSIILVMENGYNLKGTHLQCTVCILESMPLCYESSQC